MKIQLASDLHLELLGRKLAGEHLIAPAIDADLLVLAGDIAKGTRAVEVFGDWPVPVLYVAGNHEFYGRQWEHERLKLRRAAQGTSVLFLDNDVADFTRFVQWASSRAEELERLRFFGATLWTDYRYPPLRTQGDLMRHAESIMMDHRRIWTDSGRFSARQALEDHRRSRAWLETQLATPFAGKTIVVTHHAPHPISIHERFRNAHDMPANAAFVSDLSELMRDVDLWVHGHTHDSFDYRVARSRVVSNPRGYPRKSAKATKGLEFENPAFNALCVLEV